MIYCDNAATTQLDPRLADIVTRDYANPSSLHSAGRAARAALDAARTEIAASINAQAEEIIFTSGATESNNTILAALDYDILITSPSEHASLLEPAKAHAKEIVWLNLNQEGFIDLWELEKELKKASSKKILVSIMHGNNEIASVQDVTRIGALCKTHGALFHTDATQTWLKLPIDLRAMNIDALSASAHKVHGPRGVGFLYLSNGNTREVKQSLLAKALILGGGQEQGFRAGTENLASIVAMAELTKIYNPEKLRELETKLITELKNIPGLVINGTQDRAHAVPGIVNMALSQAKWLSEQLVLQMDLKGICISAGSACSANKAATEIQSSYVLRACRLPEEIASKSVRVSLSIMNTIEEITTIVKALSKLS